MIIDRTHLGWAAFTAGATLVAATLYVMTFHPDVLPIKLPAAHADAMVPPTNRAGGTLLGLIYGSLALLIFLFAGFLGWRRKHPSWRIGAIQFWLKAHIWLTLLTIPLVLFHCGFHGGGFMTQFLLWLYGFVMISGIYGLTLQHVLPHWMRQVLPDEVVFEQIPYLCERLQEDVQRCRKELETQIAARETADPAAPKINTEIILRMIDQEVMPFLKPKILRRSRLYREPVSDKLFKLIAQEVPPDLRAPVDRINEICGEKRRLNVQTRMQHLLWGWVLVHAPTSFLLIIVTIWHALVASYKY